MALDIPTGQDTGCTGGLGAHTCACCFRGAPGMAAQCHSKADRIRTPLVHVTLNTPSCVSNNASTRTHRLRSRHQRLAHPRLRLQRHLPGTWRTRWHACIRYFFGAHGPASGLQERFERYTAYALACFKAMPPLSQCGVGGATCVRAHRLGVAGGGGRTRCHDRRERHGGRPLLHVSIQPVDRRGAGRPHQPGEATLR